MNLKTFIPLILFVVLGIIVIHGPVDQRGRLENILQTRADAALAKEPFKSWPEIDVELDGQLAVLRGVAPSEVQRAQALEALRRSTGPGGWLLGGVTKVRDETNLLEVRDPFRFEGSYDGSALTLDGGASTGRSRDDILDHARRAFPSSSTIETQVGVYAGAPENADWTSGARFALDQLSRLSRGRANITGTSIFVEGAVSSAADRAAIEAATPPEGFTLRTEIAAPTGAAAAAEARRAEAVREAARRAAAELDTAAPVDALTPLNEEDVCQALFDEIMRDNTVLFATGLTEIEAESFTLLDTLARGARLCAGFRIIVEGHTDTVGESDRNQILSEARATAVVDYLQRQGVAAERLTATGFGDARPRASNDTARGRAQNRRIEFRIVR